MPAKTTQTISARAAKICLSGENGLIKFSRSFKFLRFLEAFLATGSAFCGVKENPCVAEFIPCAAKPVP